MRFVFFLLMLLISGELCLASPTQSDLKKIQAQIKEEQQNHALLQKKAKDVAREVSSVQRQMVKAANDVQDFEDTLSRLEKNLQELQEQQKLVQERLNLRQGQLVQLMSGLQKLALNPPETALRRLSGNNHSLRYRPKRPDRENVFHIPQPTRPTRDNRP